MRLTIPSLALAATLAMTLAACSEPAPPAAAPAAAADTPQGRAAFQLRSRLGGEPVLTDLRQGTDDGKAVLCGQAAVAGAAPTPFVLRGGFLVLPADSSPEQFATLQGFCTEAVTGQGRGP